MTGIYIIQNLIDGKVYIGQSKNVKKRLGIHKSSLRRGAHYNAHLQRAYQKHGEKAFAFGVVCECPEDELDLRERGWIDWYRSTNRKHGYNLESGGNALKTRSGETRRKMSEAMKGKKRGPLSKEHRRKISETEKGKIVTYATRRKISEAQKGGVRGPFSEEHRHKISEALNGWKHSNETRQKMSEAQKLRREREKAEASNL